MGQGLGSLNSGKSFTRQKHTLNKICTRTAGLTAADFIERDKFFRMGRAPVMVDILPEISGVDFDRAWQRRVEAVIGLTASFISSEDLIASKLAAGRPQDIADVAALRKTAESHPRAAKKKPRQPKKDGPSK